MAGQVDPKFKQIISMYKPALDASLDPLCIVNSSNQIVYMSLSMKGFLGIRLRDIEKGVVLCDLVKLSACRENCQILDVLKTGTSLRLDETPASKGDQKLRISLKVQPFFEGGAPKGSRPMGAIVLIRDTTGEILVQAKYHKLMELVKDRDQRIEDLEEKLRRLQKTLRSARSAASF